MTLEGMLFGSPYPLTEPAAVRATIRADGTIALPDGVSLAETIRLLWADHAAHPESGAPGFWAAMALLETRLLAERSTTWQPCAYCLHPRLMHDPRCEAEAKIPAGIEDPAGHICDTCTCATFAEPTLSDTG